MVLNLMGDFNAVGRQVLAHLTSARTRLTLPAYMACVDRPTAIAARRRQVRARTHRRRSRLFWLPRPRVRRSLRSLVSKLRARARARARVFLAAALAMPPYVGGSCYSILLKPNAAARRLKKPTSSGTSGS